MPRYLLQIPFVLEDESGMTEEKLDEWALRFQKAAHRELKTLSGLIDDESGSLAIAYRERTPDTIVVYAGKVTRED